MRLKIVVDVCLSPMWIPFLKLNGIHAVHWTDVGSSSAKDIEIMEYARQHEMIVFTHDLDFSRLLALSNAEGPSVIQIRTQNIMPNAVGLKLVSGLKTIEDKLMNGAIAVIDDQNLRIRYLPLKME